MQIDDFDAWLTEAPSCEENLGELLHLVRERSQTGHPKFYRPFPPAQRKVLRTHYLRNLPTWAQGAGVDGGVERLVNAAGTPISDGWIRIVVGDYGAYVEIAAHQARAENFWGNDRNDGAYIWLRTLDREQTKVYSQLRTVLYADYRPGFYYVAPDLVRLWP